MLVLGGRAPAFRWGQGSLQEIDHVPFVRPLVKLAATADSPGEIQDLIDEAIAAALAPHSGPVFLDFPLDHVFSFAADSDADASVRRARAVARRNADSDELERAAALLREAERPVIMAGTGLYWGRGEAELRALAEALRIPVFVNGLGRGCFPADHELYFSRARSEALKQADVALVVGVPLDFRLGFGAAFGAETAIVAIDVAEPQRAQPRALAAELYGALPATLDDLRDSGRSLADDDVAAERRQWLQALRAVETEQRGTEREGLVRQPHPACIRCVSTQS